MNLLVQLFALFIILFEMKAVPICVQHERVTLGDATLFSSLGPDLLHELQYLLIDFPGGSGEEVKNFKSPLVISILDSPFLNGAVAILHDRGSL